ncbi:MAG TPA: hypothetical protein VFJ74_04140 [Gemmatimonadaceae bacterium]|nr:hypothetical protein [Gemmatimonadaceae bacterium]
MLLSRRELTAALVAPLVAPVAYWIGLTTFGLARVLTRPDQYGHLPSLRQILWPLGFILTVGAPIAWATAAVAGLPAYLVVRGDATAAVALGTGRRAALLAVGALLGAVVAQLMKPQLKGELFSIPFPPWAGALLGLAVAATFLWMVARG